ncbi:hypothetical protein [Paenibacillus polymyxa]|uniref:hypothetical protein n=1 Tax=Paenibacillus polymyxa TaxID=1406 RepID=UPI001E286A9F|nr:hypothetical protein [Paenibacillus polymyxa]WPQ60026.1 hypothetical protein SKN87_27675 [Paenibacillus polymyxa]
MSGRRFAIHLYEIRFEHFAPKDSKVGILSYLGAESDEDGESFKDRMIRLQGNINDDEAELSDLYYGATLHGWKLKKENITSKEIDTLRSLGIQVETIIK